MGRGFDGEAQQNEGKTREAVIGLSGFFRRETEEQREVGDGAFGELLLVKREEMPEVARRGRIVQAEFCDRLGQSAGEAGCLSDRSEIGQAIRG